MNRSAQFTRHEKKSQTPQASRRAVDSAGPKLGCSRCLMSTDVDPDLTISDGECNHCRRYDLLLAARVVPREQRQEHLQKVVSAIKHAGRNHDYDCIIGVSGGVDSTYVALKVIDLGLRPLAVHVDNGWNSEIAVSNIEKMLRSLGIDLQTVVLDLREFHDLQRAFLLASTPDIDIPTDHAIQAALWQHARQHNIKYIISGMNFATESISVPSWSYGHSDWRYIKDVHRKHGVRRLRAYPHYTLRLLLWTTVVRRIRIVSILNYMNYDRATAVEEITTRLGWTAYQGKHFESIYTRWAQGRLLPSKFGIDKRRGHLSDLVNSGQLTRSIALEQLEEDFYPERLVRTDEDLLKKKLALSDVQLMEILNTPPTSFRNFKNSYGHVQRLRTLVNELRRRGLYPR
jgi:N-acetyl sugar amidotransferase